MWVSVKYDDPKNKSLVEEEIRELLRIRRKVRSSKDDDFEIFGPDSLSKLWNQLTGGLVLFMIAVSSVGLMVGGVGVMNIMLVSVTERTREIGVRKAIGATKRTLLIQFTTEAVTLCAVGGIIGILLGAILTWIIYFLPIGLPATMSTAVGAHGFRRLVRHRVDFRYLSGVEGCQPRSDRGVAIRVGSSEFVVLSSSAGRSDAARPIAVNCELSLTANSRAHNCSEAAVESQARYGPGTDARIRQDGS